jgi:dihydroorotase
LSAGADGDVTIFDATQEWVYQREDSASKSRNNPFFGWKLKGKPVAAIVAGKLTGVAEHQPVAA